jgi:predicted aconitase
MMKLTSVQNDMLDGKQGKATQKAMQILVALGKIYNAEELIPVTSVQVAGVSYDNLGEAGLQFLSDMADNGGKAQVFTTLNPAGMDIENWKALGISEEFAKKQCQVIDSFARMDIITTCSCTPYLFGNIPHFGEHIAWSESSAVCYGNSVIGARTNREGGPSALAAALTGVTPAYGYHLDNNRLPSLTVEVKANMLENTHFGALGKLLGKQFEVFGKKPIPYILGVSNASVEHLKSFCASIATYGGTAIFHMEGITPEAQYVNPPGEIISVTQSELDETIDKLSDATSADVDFVSLGCPHLSIREIARIAELLKAKKVTKEFWITTARTTKQIADRAGYTKIIEDSGAKFAADTCCVVAPIEGRFNALATDSAKMCYYAYAKNKFHTVFKSFDEVVMEATK